MLTVGEILVLDEMQVFLHAIETLYPGRQGLALTRIGGWANRLISCGAGLFVGPLWSVRDESALTFASAFYQSRFSGETVATAVPTGLRRSQTGGRSHVLSLQCVCAPDCAGGAGLRLDRCGMQPVMVSAALRCATLQDYT